MDESLLQYDESLEALEKQRKNLQIVVQKMGEEWEESGAGVGWMKKSLRQTSPSRKSRIALIRKPSQQQNDLTKFIQQNSLSVSNSNCDGPSPDYLQTLLNVNDELLAQSLASDSSSKETGSPHDLRSTSNSSFVPRLPTSPPLTDQEPFSPEQNQFISTPPFTPEERQD